LSRTVFSRKGEAYGCRRQDRERGDVKIRKELLDELLAGQDAKWVFKSEGLVDELKKALAERILNAELDHHLGQEGERFVITRG
jgi:hypothetical protein